MRRPSPLPPGPASPNKRAAAEAEHGSDESASFLPRRMTPGARGDTHGGTDPTEARAASSTPDPTDDSETAPLDSPWHVRDDGSRIAPVIPFGDERSRDRTRGTDTDDATAADATESVRLRPRDVWAAARARRRALRQEVRRFTARQRRRRRIWIGVGAVVVALVLGSVGAAYSPLFSVDRITVVGASRLDVAAVQTALSGELGTPIPLIDESAVKSALVGFPLVESYSLEARPPHELVVRIVERTPVGVLASDAGYVLVDAAGVTLATTPEQPSGYPVLDIDGGLRSDAFAAAGRVFRSLPADMQSQITTLAATTANDVTLTFADGRTVVWGGASDSARKIRVLDTLMAARADASVYDVSSPQAAVVR